MRDVVVDALKTLAASIWLANNLGLAFVSPYPIRNLVELREVAILSNMTSVPL